MLCSGAAILAGILGSLEVLGSFLGSGGGLLESRASEYLWFASRTRVL